MPRSSPAPATGPDASGESVERELRAAAAVLDDLLEDQPRGTARALAGRLRRLASAIVTTAVSDGSAVALDRLWRLIGLTLDALSWADEDDAGRTVMGQAFREATRELGRLQATADPPDATDLARRLCRVLEGTEEDVLGPLLHALAPFLDAAAREVLADWARAQVGHPEHASEHDLAEEMLLWLAENEADPELALELLRAAGEDSERNHPSLIARCLLSAGRTEEALRWMALACEEPFSDERETWLDRWVTVLEELGRPSEAQEVRHWAFEHWLSERHLRAWLERLPESECDAAEAVALGRVPSLAASPDDTLDFLLAWGDLGVLARHVRGPEAGLEARDGALLSRVAKALTPTMPAAALRLHRQLLERELALGSRADRSRVNRHRRACAELWARQPDDALESHTAFLARTGQEGGRG